MLSENNIIPLKQVIESSLQKLSKPAKALLKSQEKPDSCILIEDIFGVFAQQPNTDNFPVDQQGWVPVAKIIPFILLLGSWVDWIS